MEENNQISIHTWFFTFMCANMPIVGWFYLLHLASSKRQDLRREYAKAFLRYKLTFLVVSLLLFAIVIYIGAGALDRLLAYMEML
ncbi:MAG: hypothetical protein Q4D90_00785 [bacterium]|nr:hypothetical protein [bacterium]